jgi:amidase
MRNPMKGLVIPGEGQESIHAVVGPLANSVADMDLFQKVVLDQEPWEEETSLVPMPWKTLPSLKPEQLTIGVMWDDG